MRSMQIIEWGKPLELKEYDNPIPQGKELLVKNRILWSLS